MFENHIIVYYTSFVLFDILISRFYIIGLLMDDQQIAQLFNQVFLLFRSGC